MKRFMAVVLTVVLTMCALPVFAMGEVYTASTPIGNCSENQLTNIQLAADALNGWYVPYGEAFSFNDAIGPRSYAYGYVDANNGRGSHVIGGGVSQVATTLYLALLQMPGIHYTQITTYGDRFTEDYVSDGALAIVTDYAAAVDFAFVNYNDDLAIRCWSDGVYLYCEIGLGEGGDTSADDPRGVLIGSASFQISGSSGLINNITRAAENANGVVLEHGEVFSFNDVIGPRSESYGYVSAVNGRGVNVVGGGVAQVASVLWLAVKDMDDMTVTEKSTYGKRYNQDYVASAEDAIVTDYKAGTDFAFRYDGDGTATVYVYVDGDYLCCDIYDSTNAGGNTGNGGSFTPGNGGSFTPGNGSGNSSGIGGGFGGFGTTDDDEEDNSGSSGGLSW